MDHGSFSALVHQLMYVTGLAGWGGAPIAATVGTTVGSASRQSRCTGWQERGACGAAWSDRRGRERQRTEAEGAQRSLAGAATDIALVSVSSRVGSVGLGVDARIRAW